MRQVALGLGSNRGDRLANLQSAAKELSGLLKNIKYSPVYESDAVLLSGSPKSWNIPFLNMAAIGDTPLSARELLKELKVIERKLGRPESHEKWSPRIIDIDILAMEDSVIDEPGLIVPHPLLLERPFALFPLKDLIPNWLHPLKNQAAATLAKNLPAGSTRITTYKL